MSPEPIASAESEPADHPPALFAGVEPVEVFVELLAELDTDTTSTDFYDRICEAICRLTTMQRAAIVMGDVGRRRAVVTGSHGGSFRDLTLPTSLISTPIVAQALRADAVVVADDMDRQVPHEYLERYGISTLACTPLSAAGHAYGVILSDRGGTPFEIADGERHLLWTLGKTAALVATARNATRTQERTRRLADRIELAREIHERVVQRLFGVTLALSAQTPLDAEQRERCRAEVQEALGDLRQALERPLAPVAQHTGTTFADELARAVEAAEPPVIVDWDPAVSVPPAAEPLAQTVLGEALRNAAKHARPTAVRVRVDADEDTFTLEVRNDGVGSGARGTGMGLRLATLEALQQGGVLDFGAPGEGEWRVRLVVPHGNATGADEP
ncbi:MAG TPA: GAF domain-containing protein [Solirubrobacteraceae bacterium]|nr:GAF domain-containing protein [Solirubrobacteraceae bacterium]